MRKELDLEMLHTVTPEEFQHHLDTLTEEARTGNAASHPCRRRLVGSAAVRVGRFL